MAEQTATEYSCIPEVIYRHATHTLTMMQCKVYSKCFQDLNICIGVKGCVLGQGPETPKIIGSDRVRSDFGKEH